MRVRWKYLIFCVVLLIVWVVCHEGAHFAIDYGVCLEPSFGVNGFGVFYECLSFVDGTDFGLVRELQALNEIIGYHFFVVLIYLLVVPAFFIKDS